jgi:membrane associated rhomboid family serine protease
MASKKNKIRVTYNAPLTLSFALLALAIFLLDTYVLKSKLIINLFTCKASSACKDEALRFAWKNPLDYLKLFLHILGHSSWEHLLSNIPLILLLGPILEERYGSGILALMIAVTAFVTGVINVCFVPTALCGASGIVYMMILLSSFSTNSIKDIPLSFILVFFLYLGGEFIGVNSAQKSQTHIATVAHIVGGICGSLFAFLAQPVSKKRKSSAAKKSTAEQPSEPAPQALSDDTILS